MAHPGFGPQAKGKEQRRDAALFRKTTSEDVEMSKKDGQAQKIWDKCQDYAEKDKAAHRACEVDYSSAKKKAACHEKAAKKSAERRKKFRKQIAQAHERTLKIMKGVKGVSEEDLGTMILSAGKYYDRWDDLAKTGKGKMQAVYSPTSDVAKFNQKKYPWISWPLYSDL
jgi:hypothetical protein